MGFVGIHHVSGRQSQRSHQIASEGISFDLHDFVCNGEGMPTDELQMFRIHSLILVRFLFLSILQNGFCTTNQADGILLSEYMVHKDEKTVKSTPHPIYLIENNIRAAHVFNNSIGQVRANFAIAGLFPAISVRKRIIHKVVIELSIIAQ